MPPPPEWYQTNEFWGTTSGFIAFVLTAVGFGVTGHETLAHILFAASFPCGCLALWYFCSANFKRKKFVWAIFTVILAISLLAAGHFATTPIITAASTVTSPQQAPNGTVLPTPAATAPDKQAKPARQAHATAPPIKIDGSVTQTNIGPCGINNIGGTVSGNTCYVGTRPLPKILSPVNRTLDPAQEPEMYYAGKYAKNPGAIISFGLSDTFQDPKFVVSCDRPCILGEAWIGPTSISSGQKSHPFTGAPNSIVISWDLPALITETQNVTIPVRSLDESPVSIVSVIPYIKPIT